MPPRGNTADRSNVGWCMRICSALPPLLIVAVAAAAPAADSPPPLQLFVEAASQDEQRARAGMAALAESWRDGYAPLIIDLARLMRPRQEARMEGGGGPGGAGARARPIQRGETAS